MYVLQLLLTCNFSLSTVNLQDNFHGRYKESEYEMSDFWATNFTANLFGADDHEHLSSVHRRSSMEVQHVDLPVYARVCTFCPTPPLGQGYAIGLADRGGVT